MSLFRLIFLYAHNSCLIHTPFVSPTYALCIQYVRPLYPARTPFVSSTSVYFSLELF